MADFSWNTQSALEKALVPGRHGVAGTQAGVTLEEVSDISLVQVMARRGRAAETAKAAKKLFGIEPPRAPGAAVARNATLIWSGPDQFIVFSARQPDGQFAKVSKAFAGIASLSDQSDGRCLIRIGGPRARQALAKFCSLDLDDKAFPLGAAATTSIDHTAMNIWRGADGTDGHAVFNMLVFTSFADSLWHTVLDSSLEYGVQASSAHAA
ncbi:MULTISPECIES: sarcosine oxidase subunit gamma family protein [unclassified Mesorhizobium]|uniref:sarcosine oxidase subunit gamma n=1 Tax=unclassified Mesorhizobium TaxID=325217 RepID=UPI000FCA47C6|nr:MULTISPECIES: sarcosine oxidase subunit gamma family protein [unclassified Mesorhizobium]TIT80595.1 MAG: sarcosine oxidase subunit gamma [Mesorhizobium sp.]TGP18854.1 sarcosine oxidase subunit gamma [Mesorhizobium sp. M1D.F.Ca.ET.231.01.1.1]TGP26076.1 sarcosine oxidase subunit gamma [Mesorhizobium sp. M1D.F.Ca.ET.234.01.1.1]TGS38799.1 sarcosine oxidase subunit gamma [Mesorhizobium sp. M1D.F.Ca.ET.184.01.1.1]TGS58443.1 sarcosine oxidase subunit gamma [Mesorhizobium sp. M1D.F.Ca.ET.183.01.1.1